MADPKSLNRDVLSKFLPDAESIRRFERLFTVAGDLTPADVATLYALNQESSIDANTANSKAQSALDLLETIKQELQLLNTAPAIQNNSSLVTDYIDLSATPPHVNTPARLTWNSTDDTLDIHHTGDVTQQVGLESYFLVENDPGSTIANGSVVGFSGVGGNGRVQAQKFIADGTMLSLYIIGVLTQDILDNEVGRCTVFGNVRDIDTTGTNEGETWAVGDVLYASPTTAGAFTNVKPTAPEVSIPVAAVLVSDASEGSISVRPTIEQQLYYGSFSKTSDQTPAAANTAYEITFDSSEFTNGVTIGTPASRIVVAHAGLYTFSASFQLSSGSAAAKNAWFWFRKNGTDVANSSFKVSLDSATALSTPSRSMFFSLEINDYIELMWAADSTNVTLDAIASTAFAPASPACILTVDQIQQ